MEEITLLLIILSTIQNLLVTYFLYTLLDLNGKDRKFFVLVVLITFCQLFIRSFPVNPMIIVFFTIIIYVVYIRTIYKIPTIKTALVVTFANFIYNLTEFAVVTLLLEIFNLNPDYVLSHGLVRFLFLLVVAFIMLVLIYILKHFNLKFKNIKQGKGISDLNIIAADHIDLKREKKVSHTFYLVLLFIIIQGMFINIYIWDGGTSDFFRINPFFKSPLFINTIIVLLNIILLFLIHHLISVMRLEKEDVIKRIKDKNALRLDWEKSSQQHDRNHHLSMLYMLLQMNKIERAREYLQGMVGEMQKVEAIVKSGNQTLNALIISKISNAKTMGKTLEIEVDNPLKNMYVKDWDLNRIIGNLVDNAIEAAGKDGSSLVELKIDSSEKWNQFEVKTYGVLIPDNMQESIFERGFSSKEEEGHGLGLAICKELVDIYQGKISIFVDKEKYYTAFRVELPVAKDS